MAVRSHIGTRKVRKNLTLARTIGVSRSVLASSSCVSLLGNISSAESDDGAGELDPTDDVGPLTTVWPAIATLVESPEAVLLLEPNEAVEFPA